MEWYGNQSNFYETHNLGRYLWVYFAAPVIASVIAGLAARRHVRALTVP